MKGDARLWACLPFWINARRATTDASPFLDQWEMRYYGRISLFNEIQDAPILRASPIVGKGRHAY
jgi:hypothetical protein